MADKCTKSSRKFADQCATCHHYSQSSSDVMDVVCCVGPVRLRLRVGLDDDLTNAVTKQACVSLWWHWSTVLVNWNVFRIWLMCFLLAPVTHMCGGCRVLVIKSEWIRCTACLEMPKNIQLFCWNDRWKMTRWWNDDAKEKSDVFWFLGWFGSLPTYWCKKKEGGLG